MDRLAAKARIHDDLQAKSARIAATMESLWREGREGMVLLDPEVLTDDPDSVPGGVCELPPAHAVWHVDTMAQLLLGRRRLRREMAAIARDIDEINRELIDLHVPSGSTPARTSLFQRRTPSVPAS